MHALQSLLGLLALSLKWLVRPSGKGLKVREHSNVVPPMVGSVAVERACNARGSSYLRTWGRGCRSPGFVLLCLCPSRQATWGPILLYFLLLVSVPLIIGPQAHVRPQEKKSARCCRFVYCSKLRLLKAQTRSHWTITYHVPNTSLPVRDFSSRRTYIFNIDYFTHLSHLS